jgi:hypothetical protein
MRKLSIIMVLLLFAAIQVGTLAWYCYKPVLHTICYQLFLHRQKGRETKPILIKTSLTAFRAARQDEDEIRWNGELYDVLKTVIHGNEVLLTVEKDMAENRWLAACDAVHRQLTKNNTRQSPTGINIYQWMFKWYIPARNGPSEPVALASPLHYNIYTTVSPLSGFSNTPCQPPDMVI